MSTKRHHGDTATLHDGAPCARRSCVSLDLAPDSIYCPTHQQEIVMGLDECKHPDCDERVLFGALWCVEHQALHNPEPDPPEPAPPEPPPTRPDPSPDPFTRCRKCEEPAREGNATRGRYANLCGEHYDEARELGRQQLLEANERSGRKIGGSQKAPRNGDSPMQEPDALPADPPLELPDAPLAPLPEIGRALRLEGEQARRGNGYPWLTLETLTPEQRIAEARADAVCAAYDAVKRSLDQDESSSYSELLDVASNLLIWNDLEPDDAPASPVPSAE